jgi:hypothetical protein
VRSVVPRLEDDACRLAARVGDADDLIASREEPDTAGRGGVATSGEAAGADG